METKPEVVWLSESRGWNHYKATPWEVVRTTQSGQKVITNGGVERRVKASGSGIVGEDWRKFRIVSEEVAREQNAALRLCNLFDCARSKATKMEQAARHENLEALNAALADMAKAISAIQSASE